MKNELELLEKYKQFQKKIEDLATRWVRAMGQYSGYNSAGGVRMSYDWNFILFRANPSSSGIGWEISISAKYIEDDSTLEIDAAKWYEDDMKQRTDKSKRISELESTPEVREYLKLKNNNNFIGNNTNGIIYLNSSITY